MKYWMDDDITVTETATGGHIKYGRIFLFNEKSWEKFYNMGVWI